MGKVIISALSYQYLLYRHVRWVKESTASEAIWRVVGIMIVSAGRLSKATLPWKPLPFTGPLGYAIAA
jgi:hypothetical protein